MTKLILKCSLSLGDIVLLTAAVRDLHRSYPGQFITDVRTTCPEVWESNPYITPLEEGDPDVRTIECEFPLVDYANETPFHCLHGFIQFLNTTLDVNIRPTVFGGDIHISNHEKTWMSQVRELSKRDLPFWIVDAGGKYDYTIKWWETRRYQEVIDHFRGKIQFVQVGGIEHHHPKLEGVIDLRGRTSVRELVRLVYHSQGVLCSVTGLMHLAAAVEIKPGELPHRPCVVVAGGREPVQWEAYPFHQFIHTVGALRCCAFGGCWRSRTIPLGDEDELDRPENLCVDVVGNLPRCMDMISPAEVIRRIELYFDGGTLQYLSPVQIQSATRALSRTDTNSFDDVLTRYTARRASERFIETIPDYPGGYEGRGIVICGGGQKYFTCAWVCVKMLRHVGCRLPIQLWYLGKREMSGEMKKLMASLNVECVDAEQVRRQHPARILKGWPLKAYSILHCPFKEVLLLDSDNVPLIDPETLFGTPEFRRTGAIFWPDIGRFKKKNRIWDIIGVPARNEPEFESGQIVVDKQRCWKALVLSLWYNEHSDFYYQFIHGDKDTFHMAFRKVGKEYEMPKKRVHMLQYTMCQHDFRGQRIFQHRNMDKWTLFRGNRRIKGFLFEKECLGYLGELREIWQRKLKRPGLKISNGSIASPSAAAPAIKRRKGICLVTLYDKAFVEIAAATTARMREYSRMHGYQFVCHDTLLDSSRHPSWNKILAIREALKKRGTEWVMWCDADAMIMNLDLQLEDLIPYGYDVVFTSDTNGLNAGVFFIRNTPWVLRFLEAVYTLGEINYELDCYGNKWEQNTIKHILQNFDDVTEHVGILPPYKLSSDLVRFKGGDFVLHLMGMQDEDRLKVLRQLDRLASAG